jgi:putative DNA primase/helicase
MINNTPALSPAEHFRYYKARIPKLHKRGKELHAPCVIHRGENDSFVVDRESGAWSCPSCGRRGTVFDFEVILSGVDFDTARESVFRIVGRTPSNGDGSSANGHAAAATKIPELTVSPSGAPPGQSEVIEQPPPTETPNAIKPNGQPTDNHPDPESPPKSDAPPPVKPEKRPKRGPKIPAGFEATESGIYHMETDGESNKPRKNWVCAPIVAAGFANDDSGGAWSLVLEFSDLRKRKHRVILPRSTFAAKSGESVIRPLLEEGFDISSGKKAAEYVRQYLMQAQPEKKFLLVDKPGWYDNIFVLNDRIFGGSGTSNVIQRADPHSLLRTKGSLEDWIAGIGTHANGNRRLQFGINLAFAAPLLNLVGAQSGMFHLKAGSRQGKTTILMAAGSVCGGGGRLGYAHSWLMTPNAAELACVGHNDLLLCLDELQLVDPKSAGNLAYVIASGLGKQRMLKSLLGAPTACWRTLGLSSGEISLATHVASVEQALRGGQLVRFVEIPEPVGTPFGMFDRVPDGESGASFADMLMRNSHQCYGAPLIAFLDKLLPQRDRHDEDANKIIQAFADEVVPADASGEVRNIAERFGLVVAGGVAATRAGCTDWNEDEVWDNGVALFKEWLVARGSSAPTDEERAVSQVREILQTQSSRFITLSDADESDTEEEPSVDRIETVRDQLGFRRKITIKGVAQTVFLIWPAAWASTFCRGLDPNFVRRVLQGRGYLLTNEERRLQYNSRVPGFVGTKRFYAILETLLD